LQIIRHFYMRTPGDRYLDRATMKTPVVLVAAALTVAILVAISFVIVMETRGENALWGLHDNATGAFQMRRNADLSASSPVTGRSSIPERRR
jgi:hypothetical protein